MSEALSRSPQRIFTTLTGRSRSSRRRQVVVEIAVRSDGAGRQSFAEQMLRARGHVVPDTVLECAFQRNPAARRNVTGRHLWLSSARRKSNEFAPGAGAVPHQRACELWPTVRTACMVRMHGIGALGRAALNMKRTQ